MRELVIIQVVSASDKNAVVTAPGAAPEKQWSFYQYADGEVVEKFIEAEFGVVGLIRKGFAAFCGYVGVPVGADALELPEDFDLDVHGGVTFDEVGSDGTSNELFHWMGWDYMHFMDHTSMHDDPTMGALRRGSEDLPLTRWDIPEIREEVLAAVEQVNAALRGNKG